MYYYEIRCLLFYQFRRNFSTLVYLTVYHKASCNGLVPNNRQAPEPVILVFTRGKCCGRTPAESRILLSILHIYSGIIYYHKYCIMKSGLIYLKWVTIYTSLFNTPYMKSEENKLTFLPWALRTSVFICSRETSMRSRRRFSTSHFLICKREKMEVRARKAC